MGINQNDTALKMAATRTCSHGNQEPRRLTSLVGVEGRECGATRSVDGQIKIKMKIIIIDI